MAWIVVAHATNGDVSYFGPFLNRSRANEYGEVCARDLKIARWFINPLIVPALEWHTLYKKGA